MLLGFKPQFREKILNGTKIHTIREDAPRRWGKGKVIHFATGVRTKQYECFMQGWCTGVQEIFMTYERGLEISIGDRFIYRQEQEMLAKNDGFDSYEEFVDWFHKVIMASPKLCFSGVIIHWTNHRYHD